MRLQVRLTRPVAAFAAGIGRLFLAARDRTKVRVFVELEPYIRVASSTNSAANKLSTRRLSLWRVRRVRYRDEEQNCPGCQEFLKCLPEHLQPFRVVDSPHPRHKGTQT
jgi:DNA-binding IclR family transcriptional regulator